MSDLLFTDRLVHLKVRRAFDENFAKHRTTSNSNVSTALEKAISVSCDNARSSLSLCRVMVLLEEDRWSGNG